jgi:hypothetical protein
MLVSIQQETAKRLQDLHIIAIDCNAMSANTKLIYERELMSLYVSLEDVQLLAGKYGEDEARRILPTLSLWAQDQDSRQAIWHAGQIIKSARSMADGMLRCASAVIVYHAGLVLWAYSIMRYNYLRSMEPLAPGPQVMLGAQQFLQAMTARLSRTLCRCKRQRR